jgi:hypothetical protein
MSKKKETREIYPTFAASRKSFTGQQLRDWADEDIKAYTIELGPNDRVVMASVLGEDTIAYMKQLEKDGYNVVLMTGKPTNPPPNPPKG